MTLPASDLRPKLPRPYAVGLRVCWILTGVLLLGLATLLVYDRVTTPAGTSTPEGLLAAMFLTGVFALAMLFSAVLVRWFARPIYRQLEAFENGVYLAHWVCSPEEWAAFLDGEPERTTAENVEKLWWLTGIGGLAGLTFFVLAVFDEKRMSWPAIIGISLAPMIIFAGIGLAVVVGSRRRTRRRAEMLRNNPGDIYIGDGVAYCAGDHWNWLAVFTRSLVVEIVPGRPALLRFVIVPDTPSGPGLTMTRQVPIPADKLEDARRVVRILQGEKDSL